MVRDISVVSGRRYKGADQDERVAARREKILEAGLDLFGTRGYQATTLAMLSAQSGVPHRYLSGIFPEKEDILRELTFSIYHEVSAAIREAQSAPGADKNDVIRRTVEAICRVYLEDARKARVTCIEIVGVSTEFEMFRRIAQRELGQLILAGVDILVDAGVLQKKDYLFTSIGLVGAVQELLTEWLLAPATVRPEPEVFIRQVQDFFLGVLLSAPHQSNG